MQFKARKVDSKTLEEWNRTNPKLGFDESKIRVKNVGLYGNYRLRNNLMEVISFLKDQDNLVVIPGGNTKYFKELEKRMLEISMEMVKLL